ncbi:uncharacterized protein AB675_11079 [Cyphellophora attinorum]|uniref:Uncharacterized protein n=1 Tax=Cyphellophora attinorum TaxID=1664694 RepID=A0A0N1GYK9_9EURO|nr:uncharacterized protein AB675_11079 [Phialophora attinorum]KPI35797.1 hypothetical protein AB675_11079 [Phialophora attinorum]
MKRISFLTILALLLIPILTLVSFIFAIVATTSSYWATSLYTYIDNTGTSYYINDRHRGPFKKCLPTLKAPDLDATVRANYKDDCSVTTCSLDTVWADLPYLCQQISYTQNLLIAGIVFMGLAFVWSSVLGLIACFAGRRAASEDGSRQGRGGGRRQWRSGGQSSRSKAIKEKEKADGTSSRPAAMTNMEGEIMEGPAAHHQHHGHVRHPDYPKRQHTPDDQALHRRHRRHHGWPSTLTFIGTLTHLSIALGVLLLGLANLLGSNLLVNNVPKDGDTLDGNSDPQSSNPHWMVGRASWFAFAGWMPALVGLVLFGTVREKLVRPGR